MKFVLVAFIMVLLAPCAQAYESGEIFFDPHAGVGFNPVQGTYFTVGADAGYALSQQLAAGVGVYYAAGKHPSDDREIGGGPFVVFFQPLTSFLVAHLREDIDYIDQRSPVDLGNDNFTHTTITGVASVTTFGLHVIFTRNFGISGGYRAVLPLSTSDLGRNRSGTFLGFSIGI